MEKQPNPVTLGGLIWNLSIIHLVMIAGPMIFGILAFRETNHVYFNLLGPYDQFAMVALIFTVVGIVLGNFVFIKALKNVPKTYSLKQKLVVYKTVSITRYVLVEVPIYFGIVAFLMTKNTMFLLLSGIIILYLSILRPTKENIIRGLDLTVNDGDLFSDINEPLDS